MQDNILKVDVGRNGDSLINNYNIYKFFDYSDNVRELKLVATIINGNYFVCVDHADECYHHELVERISKRYGEVELCVYACDDKLLIWKEYDRLSEVEYQIIKRILCEMKKYCDDKQVSKEIDIDFIDYKYRGYDDISEIIKDFNSKREMIVEEEEPKKLCIAF